MKVGSTIKNYKILNELRPGAGGNVYVVEDINTHENFVLKSSYLEESKKVQFEKIVSGWKNLSGKNVVEFKEFFYEENKSYVVMEYCSGGDLESIIKKMKGAKKKFTEAEIAKIATDVLKGLQAMQAMKMIHRDLKAANILKADDGTYKLADFNVSRVLNDDAATTMTFTGTMQYVAPELLQNRPPSFASDMYALGAVFYELITLVPAFTGTDIPSMLANRYCPIDASLGYSSALAQLVHRMLALDPTARPTVDEALSAPVFVRAQTEGAEGEQRRQAASLTALQHTVADQQNTIRTLQRTVGEQQARRDEQQGKINSLQRTVEEQQGEIINLERTVTEQQAKTNEQDGRISQLQVTVEDLCRSVAASKQTAAAVPIASSKQSTPVQQSPQSQPKHICTKKDMVKTADDYADYIEYEDGFFFIGNCKCGSKDYEGTGFAGYIARGGFCIHRCGTCRKTYCKKCVAQMS